MENTQQFMTCSHVRAKGREALKSKWGTAIAVTILYSIILGAFSFVGYIPNLFTLDSMQNPIFLIFLVLFCIVEIFLTSALSLGVILCFIKFSEDEKPAISTMFSRFKIFIKATGLILWIGIKTFLWSLLFIVPGIIASYRYSMAPYIMAENPDIGINEAINQSKDMMKGYKGKFFLLQLSFIGWILLGILTLGILYIWLVPYMYSSQVIFYKIVSSEYQNKQQFLQN